MIKKSLISLGVKQYLNLSKVNLGKGISTKRYHALKIGIPEADLGILEKKLFVLFFLHKLIGSSLDFWT